MKKPTSQDVADLAGVSQSTVSLILNDNENISFSNETRERVLAAAKELNYQLPTRRRKKVKRKLHKQFLVLVPTLSNYYFTELLQMLQSDAMDKGYKIIACNTFRDRELEKYYLDEFSDQVDGILFTFLPSFPNIIENMAKHQPIIIIGEKPMNSSITSIELSNINAGSQLAEYLYNLGHRKYLFVSTPLNHFTLSREQRLQGMEHVFHSHGLYDAIEVVAPKTVSEEEETVKGFSYEHQVGYSLTSALIESNSLKATAIIGVNDMTALGVMKALKEAGLRIPEDVSVCGFDNIFPSQITTPPLTTVDHHLAHRSNFAIDMLITMSQSPEDDLPLVHKIEYTPQLVLRSSTGPAKDSEESH